jgi:hypothetical protein
VWDDSVVNGRRYRQSLEDVNRREVLNLEKEPPVAAAPASYRYAPCGLRRSQGTWTELRTIQEMTMIEEAKPTCPNYGSTVTGLDSNYQPFG